MCVCVSVPKKWGEKENCKKTEAAYEMRRDLRLASHRAPHLAWSVAQVWSCSGCCSGNGCSDHESRWPATGSNSPLNALESQVLYRKKQNTNLNFKFLWIALTADRSSSSSSSRFRLRVQLFHLPCRVDIAVRQAGNQPVCRSVCRSIGMRQIDSWFAAHSHTDQSHWSRLREMHIYASALGIISNLRQAQTHLSHLCFLLFFSFLPSTASASALCFAFSWFYRISSVLAQLNFMSLLCTMGPK